MIPKQPVGTIAKTIVSKDGLTFGAQKIVSRIGLDPTTLSDIITDTTSQANQMVELS
ncbi:hypothetical protein [Carnobacterium maltaromaticum]|uniref:hypothetical protein n=1 Tax=Carnobacterium maltaromaticum TaxID=2751 RepID=UPI00191BB6A4|nr:hypothetical protein [Carnobacterium maltaromaticum]CAD5900047.1 hypothetical protein CMALT394_290007 [Carnobacterium maltaromaticum]